MSLRPFSLAIGVILTLAAAALASPLDDGISLYRDKKYPAAREAFEKIATSDPKSAAACYYLGMTLRHRGDATALDDAARWLAKAVELEPANATYLADFGGTSLQLGEKTRSLSAVAKGRDAMIRAIELTPDNLDVREELMQFYARAPFFVGGSNAKAYAQASEIRQRFPQRGLLAFVSLKILETKFDEALALCDDALKASPDNYVVLYQIGRIAEQSDGHSARGLAALRRCLELTPPPNAPTHASIQFRLGKLAEKKGDTAAARTAYESALKLEPEHQAATSALAKLK
jgi:tetratricopeptide (TPR) repeat protein